MSSTTVDAASHPSSLQAVYCTVSYSVTAGQYTHSAASTPAPLYLPPSSSSSSSSSACWPRAGPRSLCNLARLPPPLYPYLAAYSPAATPVSGSAWHSCCSCWPWATLSGPCLPTHEGMLGFYSATEASTCDHMMLQGYTVGQYQRLPQWSSGHAMVRQAMWVSPSS